jgi:CO/xanthine dehydrogenase FAD-binding subunit
MIARDLRFVQPTTVAEALSAWAEAKKRAERPVWMGGGTELVTQGRDGKLNGDVLIDTKRITGCSEVREDAERSEVIIGSAVRLSHLPAIPLLLCCAAGVADRTVRNSITLGGNICGMLAYREAALPFLLLGGRVELAGPEGNRIVPLHDVFNKRLQKQEEEIVLSFRIDADIIATLGGETMRGSRSYGPVIAGGHGEEGGWFYCRRTQEPRVDYPVVTVAMAIVRGTIRIAHTGAYGYPVRAEATEAMLSQAYRSSGSSFSRAVVEEAVDAESRTFKSDFRASREYRREGTIQAIAQGLQFLYDQKFE